MPKRRKLNNRTPESTRVLPKRFQTCPICSHAIPVSELYAHYKYERSLLSGPDLSNKRPAAVQALAKIVNHPQTAKRSEAGVLINRVRANRDARRNNHIADDETSIDECPICGLRLRGIGMSASEHVSSCLDAQQEESGTSGWDEYEIAGQRRTRVISLLPEGVRSIPGAVIRSDDEGGDEFIDVEGNTED